LSAPDRDRDLARIEQALAEGRPTATDPRERELEELALALRSDSPEPDPAFARRLDERVADGFANRERRRLRVPRLRFGWMPALAAGTAVVIAAVVAVGVISGTGEEEQPGSTIGVAEDAGGPAPTTPLPPAQGGATTTGRQVERSAEMTIAAAADRIARAAEGIGRAAESHGGYVVNSSVSTGDDSRRGGTFTLRVPSKQLEATLADIGALGEVRSRNETSQDMTAPFRSTEKRLGNALLERRATQDELRNAPEGSDEEEALRARLRVISAEIRDLNGQMEDLRRRTVFSTVDVTLEEQRDTGAGAGGGGPGDALGDALGMLEGALVLAIRSLGVALPLTLVGLLGWLAAGVLRRRRREAALF
jgi:hypothetical protein